MDIFKKPYFNVNGDLIAETLEKILTMYIEDFQTKYDSDRNVIYTNYNFYCNIKTNNIDFIKFTDVLNNDVPAVFLSWSYINALPYYVIFGTKGMYEYERNVIRGHQIKTEINNGIITVLKHEPVIIYEKWKLEKHIHPLTYVSWLKDQPSKVIIDFFRDHVNI